MANRTETGIKGKVLLVIVGQCNNELPVISFKGGTAKKTSYVIVDKNTSNVMSEISTKIP